MNFMLKFLVYLLPVTWTDRLLHSFMPHSERSLKLLYRLDPAIPDLISKEKVMALFRKAVKQVPAYREFLRLEQVDPAKIRNFRQFEQLIPVTTKENYIHRFPMAERCLHGLLPRRGVIEESSGTSGKSTFWMRSSAEERDYRVLIRSAFPHLYGFGRKEKVIVLNGFMTGGWTGNAKFGERIGSRGISRNTGPDPEKIIRCLREFGREITYLIGGYPPFLLKLIEFGRQQADFNWKDYRVHLYTSG